MADHWLCVCQVPWKVQLLATAIEEAAKYAVMVSSSPLAGSTALLASGRLRAALRGAVVVAVAGAVSALVEVLHVLIYSRVAGAPKRTARGDGGKED
jgi:hypothetical protein